MEDTLKKDAQTADQTSKNEEEKEQVVEAIDLEDIDSEDSLTFSNGVIEKIVAIAVRDVDGVLGMSGGWYDRFQETFGAKDPGKGVSVEVTSDNAVRINISVLIAYGAYAPQIFDDVKKAVVEQVAGMTGLEVAGVNLRIEDVLTEDEYERSRHAKRVEKQKEAQDEEQLEQSELD